MSKWTEHDILTNGIRLHYYRTGGEKPPIVLCHGFSDNGLCWTPLARELEADYDVIMVDARCHGKSEAPRDGNGTEAMADDLAGLITGLGLDRPAVVGHSMGARYATDFASRYHDLTRGIALEDAPWRDQDPIEANLSAEEREALVRERGADIVRRNRMTIEELIAENRQQSPRWSEEIRPLWAVSKQQLSPSILTRFERRTTSWRENLTTVRCPVLMITADPTLGAIVTDAIAAEAKRLCPQIERVQIAGAGHCIRYEQFDAFVAALKPFLARLYA